MIEGVYKRRLPETKSQVGLLLGKGCNHLHLNSSAASHSPFPTENAIGNGGSCNKQSQRNLSHLASFHCVLVH